MPPTMVSLVPSLTELLFWLGAGDRLVGRTRFCEEPADRVKAIPAFGGTKDPKVDRIVALQPGLVIANKEENRREDIEALRAAGLHVVLTDPNTVAEAVDMILEVGRLVGRPEKAAELAADIRGALAVPPPGRQPRAFVAVWNEPLLGLGSESYGHDLLQSAGAVNIFVGRPRYPETSLDEIAALRPDVILLPDEPYPFKQRHIPPFAAIAPTHIIDGKAMWWYGPRIPSAIATLRGLLKEYA